MAPFSGFVVSLNRSRLIKSRLPVTFKCLYNVASLSHFGFYCRCKVDVASVVSGSVNDVSSTLLAFGDCNYHNLRLEPVEFLPH